MGTTVIAIAIGALIALVVLIVAFYLGRRHERSSARRARARLYPKIASAMDLFVDEVSMIVYLDDLETIAAKSREAVEGPARQELIDRGTYLRNEFRRLLQGNSAMLPAPVAARLWAVDNAYRRLIRPASDERIDLDRVSVLITARDDAHAAMSVDVPPEASEPLPPAQITPRTRRSAK
jgi:hypothetical protein